MPRCKQSLKDILPAKTDQDKIEELLYMVRTAQGRDWGLDAVKRRRIGAAIHRLSKAADTLDVLRLNWVGVAAQQELQCDPRGPINLMHLQKDLRRACQALEKGRITMQRAKRPFLHDATARFVAYLWECMGRPCHDIATNLLRPILGPEYAHKKWCANHKPLIEWHRRKARQFGLYNPTQPLPETEIGA